MPSFSEMNRKMNEVRVSTLVRTKSHSTPADRHQNKIDNNVTVPGAKKPGPLPGQASQKLDLGPSRAPAPPPPRSGASTSAYTSPARAPAMPPRAGSFASTAAPSEGIFVNLSEADREAFFALLDEYFESRPHLLAGGSAPSSRAPAADPVASGNPANGIASAAATAALRNPSLASSALQSRGASPAMADAVGRFGAKHSDVLGRVAGHAAVSAASAKASPPPPPPAAVESARPGFRVPPPPAPRGLGRARALYPYESDAAEDLTFDEGDEIVVFEHVDDAWWKGSIGAREGIFPASYVQAL